MTNVNDTTSSASGFWLRAGARDLACDTGARPRVPRRWRVCPFAEHTVSAIIRRKEK